MSRPLSLKRHGPAADDHSQRAVGAQKPQQLHTPPLTPERPTVVRVTMPRQLATPEIAPVSSEALVSIDPALANIPVGFIRQRVLAMSKDIWDGLTSCTPKTALTSPLPRAMEVVTRPDVDASMLPTHYLLVYNHRTPNERGRLYPANSLLLATQCASLPRFGPTTRELREDNTFEVPIVAFSVPCPAFFHPLYLYLNTQNVNSLLASLIPLPTPALDKIKFTGSEGNQGVTERLAESLADWLSIRALLSTLKLCHGVWSNACALQVNDDRLWRVISYAWNIVIAAVERSSGRPAPPVESIVDDADADAVDRALGDAPPPYDA